MTSVVPHAFVGTEIELANGLPFNPAKPDHRVVDLESIAHSLSNQTRYGGHCLRFYSISEHAVLVANKLRRIGAPIQMQMAGLHHDDSEALDGIGDVQRPAKPLLDSDYRDRVRKIDRCVWRALAWPNKAGPMLWSTELLRDPLLKRVDRWALMFEAKHLMRSGGQGWEQEGTLGAHPIPEDDEDAVECWLPLVAREAFIALHELLSQEILGK